MNRLTLLTLVVTLGAVGCTRPQRGIDEGEEGVCAPNPERCDGLDNDCDGEIDEDFDFTSPETCGTCANDCRAVLANVARASMTCTPSAEAGAAGTCGFTACAANAHDLDPAVPGCEYRCVRTADVDVTCNKRDDDCDGVVDEDVDFCGRDNCGACNAPCFVVHGTPSCTSAGGATCDRASAQCSIAACDPGFVDLDGRYETGCEYECTVTGVEICGDGVDNDCDGKIDADDDLSGDPAIGSACYGGVQGQCAEPMHAGITGCEGNRVVCAGPNVLRPGDQAEVCDGKDNDCDGVVDDQPTDVGGPCGSSNTAPCRLGVIVCDNGLPRCAGAIEPEAETCNNVDDDCNGAIDDNAPEATGVCNQYPAPPMGATSACMAGSLSCVGGQVRCNGGSGPSGVDDTCGVDANCDGQLNNQPDTDTSIDHCGGCGRRCGPATGDRTQWKCIDRQCQFQGCPAGQYDLDGDGVCEYACTFTSAQEACNNKDDDCDGQIDEDVVGAPQPSQVCGVSPSATRAECTSGVDVRCVNGGWRCTFPAGVCSPTCSSTAEICDGLDNDCDGLLNENVANFGKPCASDDSAPSPGHGACRTTGTFACNGHNAVACNATKADCATLPGGCTELCDGIDNDCDGLIDETFAGKGSNTANFVKPAVVKVGASLWTYAYEASRPSATATTPGTGNGWRCSGTGSTTECPSAPAGERLDRTAACSATNKQPWTNITGDEARNACSAMGGRLCTFSDWQTACQTTSTCTFGYSPRGVACTTPSTASKYCNLGSFDSNSMAAGIQNASLPTASSALQNCWTDWSGLEGNPVAGNKLYDITGNSRELTVFGAGVYALMGGSFLSESEPSAACSYDLYRVDKNFQLFDVGFRCCFSADPRL